MSTKKSAEPSPQSVARAERQRVAKEEGAQAMAEAERRSVELRQNMQRLRALREAKQADEDGAEAPAPKPAKKKRVKRIVK
ncbi:MAG: transcriptional regulator [Bradyrhizobium sp.]|jgi:hypothetical protein|uniref:transcriptional regulator n=1 Tax=Bradyrhizobium sp. TaxID=376 RepID=UPI003C7AA48E